MRLIYKRKLLLDHDLSTIRELIHGLEWVDGSTSSGNPRKKNNHCKRTGPNYEQIDKIVASSLFDDDEYTKLTQVDNITFCDITRTRVGGEYPLHVDSSTCGQYSTTIFLSDPDTYEGGELAIKCNGEVEKYKLPAGYAVTYLTGLPHAVLPVTSGERLVVVNWTHSKIKDSLKRDIAYDLERAVEIAHDTLPEPEDFLESSNSLRYILKELLQKYYRNYQ